MFRTLKSSSKHIIRGVNKMNLQVGNTIYVNDSIGNAVIVDIQKRLYNTIKRYRAIRKR